MTSSDDALLIWHETKPKNEVFALTLLFLCLILHRASVLPMIGSEYIGGFYGDPGLYIWLFRTVASNLLQFPWFDTGAFYPYGYSLAFSDSFLVPSLLGLPFKLLGVGDELAFNTLILMGNFLTGYVTYRLAYNLIGDFFPSLLSGIIFMGFPFITGHLGHSQLQFAFFIPLSILLAFRALALVSYSSAFVSGLSIAVAFTFSAYYAIFSVFFLLVLAVALLLLRPSLALRRDFQLFVPAFVLGLLPLCVLLSPYFAVRSTLGERFLYESYYFSANLLSFFSAPATSLPYRFTSELSHAEANLFPGVIAYILSGIAIVRLFQARPIKKLGIFFLSVFFSGHF